MSQARRFDHVGITVADLDTVAAFFVGLGLEVEGRMFVEGEFLDTVSGIPDSRTEIVLLRLPDGGTGLELSSFVRPTTNRDHGPRWPTSWGCRNVTFEVDDLQAAVDRLAADGYGLVGGIGQYEHTWRRALRARTGGDQHEELVDGRPQPGRPQQIRSAMSARLRRPATFIASARSANDGDLGATHYGTDITRHRLRRAPPLL
jgi:catechol 2,3-dioxygenase-like lactoylglutathione lyase family enzyme